MDTTPLADVLLRQIADLKAELAKDPRIQRLEFLEATLRREQEFAQKSRRGRKQDEKTALMLAVAGRLIDASGDTPVPVSEMIKVAEGEGIISPRNAKERRKESNKLSAA